MSLDKEREREKRPSKLFGTRISSIFSSHGNSSQEHLNPQRQAHQPSQSANDGSNRSIKLKNSSNSLKPLSRGPFSNYLHNRSNASIDLKSSSFVFDSRSHSSTNLNHHNHNNSSRVGSNDINKQVNPAQININVTSPSTSLQGPSNDTIKNQTSPDSLHEMPKSPRRKPPPPMLDEPNRNARQELEKLPSLSRLNQPSLPASNKAVHDDLNDIIGTLELEIGSMMNRNSIHKDQLSVNDSPQKQKPKDETSPLPEPQSFLFDSPTKSIDFNTNTADPVRITRSQGNTQLSDYNTTDESDIESLIQPPILPHGLDKNDTRLSDGSYTGVPYPIDSPVVPSPISQNFNPDITFDDLNHPNFSQQSDLGRNNSISSDASSNIAPPESPINYYISGSNNSNPNGFSEVLGQPPGPLTVGQKLLLSSKSSIYSPNQTDLGFTQNIPNTKKLNNIQNNDSTVNSLPGQVIQTVKSNSSISSRPVPASIGLPSSATIVRGGSLGTNATSSTGATYPTNASSSGRVPLKQIDTSLTFDSFPRSISTSSRLSGGQNHSSNHGLFSHRKSSSISSLFSSNSSKNVNLAALKKTLNLQPGEGERSNYVLTLRRSLGTALNETGPGKWKLPTGIQPIDKNATTYVGSNGRYMRLGQAHTQGRAKKVSGVELKHGHLQPRLLATEVNDLGENGMGSRPKAPTSRSSLTNSIGGSNSVSYSNGINGFKSSSSSIIGGNTSASLSRNSSLARTATMGSIATGNESVTTGRESSASTNFSSSKRTNSISSSSSGSLSDSNLEIGGYYQHPGYRYDDDNDLNVDQDAADLDSIGPTDKYGNSTSNGDNTVVVNDYDDYDDKPRLVLANPDYSSDSN